MKNLLTLAVSINFGELPEAPCDGIEIISIDENESEKDFLARAVKGAKGKYTVICDRKFAFADVQSLLNIIDKNSSDMVSFTSGAAIKTSVLKGLKDYTDSFSFRLLAVTGCKSILKTVYLPFTFEKSRRPFRQENVAGLAYSAETFGKVKAKLNKEIYSYAFNMLCDRLIAYYIFAMLAIKDGDLQADELIEFDNKLKAEIVLYLALEKRFTYAKLQKLREDGFKIGWLTARKFRKI